MCEFLGANFHGVLTPSSNREQSQKHLKEKDVLAAEDTYMPPNRCWPVEGWVRLKRSTLRVAFNTKCGNQLKIINSHFIFFPLNVIIIIYFF